MSAESSNESSKCCEVMKSKVSEFAEISKFAEVSFIFICRVIIII